MRHLDGQVARASITVGDLVGVTTNAVYWSANRRTAVAMRTFCSGSAEFLPVSGNKKPPRIGRRAAARDLRIFSGP
jgi:hypothetical protein